MTEEQLNAIRERCEKATPGPWVKVPASPGTRLAVFNRYGIEQPEDADGNSESICYATGWMIEDNAEFIAHARTDIPALVAEVERLRSLVETLVDTLHAPDSTYGFENMPEEVLREAFEVCRARRKHD